MPMNDDTRNYFKRLRTMIFFHDVSTNSQKSIDERKKYPYKFDAVKITLREESRYPQIKKMH